MKTIITSDEDLTNILEAQIMISEFPYNNDTVPSVEIHRCNIENLKGKFKDIKDLFPKKSFIFPTDYLFDFIDYTFQILDLFYLNFKFKIKLEEVNKCDY